MSAHTLYYGTQQIDSDLTRIGLATSEQLLPYSYHAICPGCCKYFRFGRWSENKEFRYPIDEYGQDHQIHGEIKSNHKDDDGNIVIDNIDDFKAHTSDCAEPLSDGLHHVSRKKGSEGELIPLTPYQSSLISLASRFSRFSRKETGFGSTTGQASKDQLSRGECQAYIMIEEGIPVSYVATTRRFFLENVESQISGCYKFDLSSKDIEEVKKNSGLEGEFSYHGGNWIISDLFTLPDYRRRGFSKKLLSHVISEKEIDMSQLYVTVPLTESSQALFSEMSTESIIGCKPEHGRATRKNSAESISWVK